MQSLFTAVKSILVIVFVASCAYEPDSSLRPNSRPKPQVNDAFKGKANYEILTQKYENLAMNCEVVSEVVAPDMEETVPSEFSTSVEAPTPPATEPVVNSGTKTKFDLVAQMGIDPKLRNEQLKAEMVLPEEDRTLTLKLKIKPVIFVESLNIKLESSVYIMKYSPTLKLGYTLTTSTQGRSSSVEGTFDADVYEGVPFKEKFSEEDVQGKKTIYYAKCDFKGQFKSGDDLATQWLRIDCSKPAEVGKEQLHAANCRAGMPIPDDI